MTNVEIDYEHFYDCDDCGRVVSRDEITRVSRSGYLDNDFYVCCDCIDQYEYSDDQEQWIR